MLGGMSVHILQHRPPRVRLPCLGLPGPPSRLRSHIWGPTAPPTWALEQSAGSALTSAAPRAPGEPGPSGCPRAPRPADPLDELLLKIPAASGCRIAALETLPAPAPTHWGWVVGRHPSPGAPRPCVNHVLYFLCSVALTPGALLTV